MGCLVQRSMGIDHHQYFLPHLDCSNGSSAFVHHRRRPSYVACYDPSSSLSTVPGFRATALLARGGTCISRRDTMLDCMAGTITT